MLRRSCHHFDGGNQTGKRESGRNKTQRLITAPGARRSTCPPSLRGCWSLEVWRNDGYATDGEKKGTSRGGEKRGDSLDQKRVTLSEPTPNEKQEVFWRRTRRQEWMQFMEKRERSTAREREK